jgi:DNA polymerase-3 subunit gamma/tau
MTLNVKYRPQHFDEVYGNDSLVESLQKKLKRKEGVPHSYLFTGAAGTGKTTFGYLLKSYFDISNIDFIEYNAANTRGIDTSREVLDTVGYAPMASQYKMYLFDECHQLTQPAQEALLKIIETPPDHILFVLCTTEPERLKDTLLRRVHKFSCRPLMMEEMKILLEDVCEAEETTVESAVLDKIVAVSNGSPGVALNLLDMVIDSEGEAAVETITEIAYDTDLVKSISRVLIDNAIPSTTKWRKISKMLVGVKGDAENIRRGILGYLNKVHLGSKGSLKTLEMMGVFENSIIYSGAPGLTVMCHLACLVE